MVKKIKKYKTLKNKPFVVPEGYFDTFSERLIERIDFSEKPAINKTKSTIIRYLKPVLAMTASFTVIFMLIFFPVRILSPNLHSQNTESIFYLPEFINFYQVNDHDLIQAYEQNETEYEYDDQFIENLLIASLSEYDLIQLNNYYNEN